MSKTLKLNVSFPMSIVFKAEAIEALEKAREECRAFTPEKIAEVPKGEGKARLEMFVSDMTTERLLEVIVRAGIREHMRGDFLKEIQGSESRCRVGSVKVAFEAPMVPRSCDRCIETNCVKSERNTNAGCEGKRTAGLRPPTIGSVMTPCCCGNCMRCNGYE